MVLVVRVLLLEESIGVELDAAGQKALIPSIPQVTQAFAPAI